MDTTEYMDLLIYLNIVSVLDALLKVTNILSYWALERVILS